MPKQTNGVGRGGAEASHEGSASYPPLSQNVQYDYFVQEMEKHEHEEAYHNQVDRGQEKDRLLAWCSSPQSKLLERAPRGRLSSLFRTGFLFDEGHIPIEGQLLPMEPFNGHLLDERAFVPDLEDLLGRIDEEEHRRSCQRLLDVIRFEIYIDTAIGAHATGEGLLMNACQASDQDPPFRAEEEELARWEKRRAGADSDTSARGSGAPGCSGAESARSPHAPPARWLVGGSVSIPDCNCGGIVRQ